MDDVYGGTYRLFERVRRRSAGLDFSFVDLNDLAALEAAITPNTKLIWCETPTNPMLKIVDIARLAEFARKRGICAGGRQHLLPRRSCSGRWNWARDLVMHSATKYLNGHSDMVGGMIVVGDDAELAEQMTFLQNAIGGVQGPFDSFLALRGLKTLHLRMKAHCENADAARRMAGRRIRRSKKSSIPAWPRIRSTNWPRRQMHGFGGMISVWLKGGLPSRAPLHGAHASCSPAPNRWAASKAWSTTRRS